jgi:hypothetical protein
MEEEEHPGSGCGVLFFNFAAFFDALFAMEEDGRSGFSFAFGLVLEISS